jgi:hypothetical protein
VVTTLAIIVTAIAGVIAAIAGLALWTGWKP